MAKRHRRGRPVHGILLLDKPSGGSSNHALQRAKRLFGASKAGHTGSLDPLATGMLPICFGEATKLSAYLLDADKGYETTLKLGATTDSADADGVIVQTRSVPDWLDHEQFANICRRFTGPLMQVPPMVSAIKIDGQRLYKLARQGKEVKRPARPVTIHHLEVQAFYGDIARLSVHCSKGTYIRSLVTDIGEAIGCGAHVTALRRSFVSPFEQYPMVTLETLERMISTLPLSSQPIEPDTDPITDRGAGSSTDRNKISNIELSIAASKGMSDDSNREFGIGGKSGSIDQFENWAALDTLLLPPDAGLDYMPIAHLDAPTEKAFYNGNAAPCELDRMVTPDTQSLCRVYDSAGRLAGLGELTDARTVSPRRVLQWG